MSAYSSKKLVLGLALGISLASVANASTRSDSDCRDYGERIKARLLGTTASLAGLNANTLQYNLLRLRQLRLQWMAWNISSGNWDWKECDDPDDDDDDEASPN